MAITFNRNKVVTPVTKRTSALKGTTRGAINVPNRVTVHPNGLKIEDAELRAKLEGRYAHLGIYGTGTAKKFAIYIVPETAIEWELFHKELAHEKKMEKLPEDERTPFTMMMKVKNNINKGSAEYFEYERKHTSIGKHKVSMIDNGFIKFNAADKEAPHETDKLLGQDAEGKPVYAIEGGWAAGLSDFFNHNVLNKEGERLKLDIAVRRDTLNFRTDKRNPKFTDDNGEWMTKEMAVFTSEKDEDTGHMKREVKEVPTVRYLNKDVMCDVIVLDSIWTPESKATQHLKASKRKTNATKAGAAIFKTKDVKTEIGNDTAVETEATKSVESVF